MRVDRDDDAPIVFEKSNFPAGAALVFEQIAELGEEFLDAFAGQRRELPTRGALGDSRCINRGVTVAACGESGDCRLVALYRFCQRLGQRDGGNSAGARFGLSDGAAETGKTVTAEPAARKRRRDGSSPIGAATARAVFGLCIGHPPVGVLIGLRSLEHALSGAGERSAWFAGGNGRRFALVALRSLK
ncbi:MAG: hypothetical protein ACLPSW_19160 [Roseiarcus sp.]